MPCIHIRNDVTKYIDFFCQSYFNFNDTLTILHLMKYVLTEQNLFIHFRFTSKNANTALLLPLYVFIYLY